MTALILLAFGVPILVVGAIYVVVRPRINHGGASDQEHVSTCPGEELVARPSFVWTNAITIKAPAGTRRRGQGSLLAHRGSAASRTA
jgi:hypothetical protein